MIKTSENERWLFAFAISFGIFLRFFVMTFGNNYDFESYLIVGKIAGNFRNVYAETFRYNYGPIFLCLQGLLYRLSLLSATWEYSYRVLMVSALTFADLGITCFIANRYSIKKSLIFFLNPISIIITGYHNQFDNIAVLLALLCILYYNEEERITKKDFFFVLFLSLSLIVKHVFLIFPLFILLRKRLSFKKRLLYSFVPPMAFVFSLVPFALQSKAALTGIINNVFLYKSSNNSPLFSFLFKMTGLSFNYGIFVFAFFMVLLAFITRHIEFDRQVFIYLISLVAFSSAIANQYLVIPICAITVLRTGILKHLYISFGLIYLLLSGSGLRLQNRLVKPYLPAFCVKLGFFYLKNGYCLLTWILLIILLYDLCFRETLTRIKGEKTAEKT